MKKKLLTYFKKGNKGDEKNRQKKHSLKKYFVSLEISFFFGMFFLSPEINCFFLKSAKI